MKTIKIFNEVKFMTITYSSEHLINLATLIDLIFGDVVLASVYIYIYILINIIVCVRSKHIPNIHQTILLMNRYEYNIEN